MTAGPAGAQDSRRPSVLLISIDTLRADHLGAYGYPRPTDPLLQQRTRGFTRFTAASTPIPLTVPAHGALLSGRHPLDLGLLNNRQALRVADDDFSLATSLQRSGYVTAAVVGSRVLDGGHTGLDHGFDIYMDPDPDRPRARRTAHQVNGLVGPVLEQAAAPLFLLVHYYDVHEPYEVPDRLACLLRPDDSLDEVMARRGLAGIAYESVLNRRRLQPVEEAGRITTLRQMIARYDAAVRLATDSAAALLEMWEASRHGPGSLVIITSDHGEGLGEHGFWSHGMNLYNEALQVPLLVRWPDRKKEGGVDGDPVSLLDLAPTILAVAGQEPPAHLPGRDLRRQPGAAPHAAEPFIAQRMRYLPRQRPAGLRNWRAGDGFAVLEGAFKYIHEEGDLPRLYDRSADPLEQRNLLLADPQQGDRFHEILAAWLRDHGDEAAWPPPPVDARRLQMLRSLGYADP